jgi:hypothetical protein
MKLLIELIAAISKLIKAWENFNSSNGDIGYLIDSVPGNSHCRTRLSLRAVKDTFETMEGLQQTLFSLEKVCRDSADAVSQNCSLLLNYFSSCFSFFFSFFFVGLCR